MSVVGRGGTAELDGLSKGDIFDLLRNERRRYVLHYMKGSGEDPVELGTLATTVAAWENGVDVGQVSSTQRKRVYTTLQQTHLPRLDDADIVAYDADRGLVRPTDRTEKLSVYLEIVPNEEFPWREYYLSLGMVSLGLVTALWLGVYPLTLLSDLAWAGVVASVLTLSAAVHVYRERRMRLGAEDLPPELRS